jgi:hypothetical protein
VESLIAIGLLGLIALAGWVLYAKEKKASGTLIERVSTLEAQLDARIAQEHAFDRARGGDLADDRDRLPDVP